MKTKTINLYSFQELSETAKKKALESLYDLNVNFEWWEFQYEDAKNIGLKITEFDLDNNRHAKGEFLISANEVAANIFRDHGHDCETFKTAKSFMAEWQPVFDSYMDETSDKYESRESENDLQEIEDEFLKSLLEDYSIMLQKEYEYRISEDAIIETIEANEYSFTESGKLEN